MWCERSWVVLSWKFQGMKSIADQVKIFAAWFRVIVAQARKEQVFGEYQTVPTKQN